MENDPFNNEVNLQDQTLIPGFGKPRNCLDNKYIDADYWPIVAAVRIYYDSSDHRVLHLGAKYRFINLVYPKDIPNEFEGHGFTAETSVSFENVVEINF